MINKEIAELRLINQQISTTKFKNESDILSHMGAIQAQDYAMAKWAIGIRLPKSSNEQIESALAEGTILRTHVLRPTWHLVSPSDISWMIDLSAPQIIASLKSRHKELELTQSILKKSFNVIERLLEGNKHLRRTEIMDALERSKISTEGQRSAHIMLMAELTKIVCSGAMKGKQQTYALLSERVTKQLILKREEALSKLAKIYFNSRGPATIQDFSWWSGLNLTEAKKAVEMIKNDFIKEVINSTVFYFPKSNSQTIISSDTTYFLPAFDEFIISYKDRTAALPIEKFKHAISDNGLFRPVIVNEGKVIGIWKREIKKEKALIEIHLFEPKDKKIIEQGLLNYGKFINQKLEIIFLNKMKNK